MSEFTSDQNILMINKGQKIAIGTMNEIKKMCSDIEYEIEFNVKDDFDFDVVKNNGNFIARTKNLVEFNTITGWVAGHNGKIINIKTLEKSLEDIFLKLMN